MSLERFGRAELRSLVWPLLLELALGITVGLIGTALAARTSDTAGAAFALGNHLFGLLFMVFRLVGAGVSVVISQNLGAGQLQEARRVAFAGLAAATWLGLAVALLALTCASPLLGLLNAPAEVMPLAAPFLMALAPALLLDAWTASMASVMRAHLRNTDTLRVTWAMHTSHLLLALPLMGGAGLGSGLGLPGFALALALSRVLGFGLYLWLWRWRLQLRPGWRDGWQLRWAQLGPVLHIGLPGAAENLAWQAAFMVSVAAVGVMGTQALATQTYVLQLNMWILISAVALGVTVEMVVGRMVGARALHEAHRLVLRAQALGLSLALLIAVLMALASPWVLRLFTDDPDILRTGQQLMWWAIALETGRTFNLIVIGALRATGDARYPVLAGAGSMAVVLAGGSWWLGVHLGWGLVGVWIAYAADEWIRGLLMWLRWVRLGWVPHARAVQRRTRGTPTGVAATLPAEPAP
ncbi:MAG: MATE family efflux transporter [Limnohabitans sp.]|jgi:putative MATE family efflux protein